MLIPKAHFAAIFYFNFFVLCFASFNPIEQTWTWNVLRLTTNSSNEDLLKIDVRVVRVKNKPCGFTGSIKLNANVTDETEIEVISYRSATGSSEYTLLPFTVPRQNIYAAMNIYYKDFIMSSVANCSNLPQFTKEISRPFERKTYILEQCIVSTKDFPLVMLEGYYKILVLGYGPVTFSAEFITQVEKKVY